MRALKLCLVSAEILPFAKTGGLADVVGALVRELSGRGHEVRAFMPLYAQVARARPALRAVPGLQNVGIVLGSRAYTFSVHSAPMPGGRGAVHFVDCPELYDRPSIYTRDPDEHRRFLLLTRAALESCLRTSFAPDIFHCHDWHAAFLPLYLKSAYRAVPLFAAARSVLTIHNIGYQGVLSRDFGADLGIPDLEDRLDREDLERGVINALRTGVRYADEVTTVSPTYAREICSAPLGMGLERTLSRRPRPVLGILNGVDYQEWDPRHDPYLEEHFSPEDLRGKRLNKQRLLRKFDLRLSAETPLVGMVSRLASQKGFDLLVEALPPLLEEGRLGLAVLGSGEERYVRFLDSLMQRFSDRVAVRFGHDEALAHAIEASSDLFLMPSQYEPCGLNQMYSLRYGTVPIVRRTGGLADSVQHFDPARGAGTGCLFNDYDAPAVRWAVETALGWYATPAAWTRVMQNGMQQDFSWERRIGDYERLFSEARPLSM
jgi:starch synthase